MFWCGVLIAVVLVLGVVSWWVRRRLFASAPDAGSGDAGWTLQNLRQMRSDGVISETEFARLKEKMLNSPDVRMLRRAAGGDSDMPRS